MKNLLIACILCASFTTSAQQYATQFTQCQLAMVDILSQQSFDIDEPVSEEAREIFRDIYEELNLIYQANANDPALPSYVAAFNQTLDQAALLSLNTAMFQADINYVASLNI